MTTQNAFTREDLLRCSRGELFGPGNAQLPAPNMLMVDRITHISAEGGKYGKGELVAELDINPDLWFFACHFEGDPVMPPAWASTPCGSWSVSSSAGKACRAAAVRWVRAK